MSESSWDLKKVVPFVLGVVIVVTVVAALIFGHENSSNNPVSGNVVASGNANSSKAVVHYNSSGSEVQESSSSLSALSDSIKNSTRIYNELNNCTSLCAGDNINIPAVKDQCYSSCYKVYYSGGENALIDFINGF